jgi:hypothetical protein
MAFLRFPAKSRNCPILLSVPGTFAYFVRHLLLGPAILSRLRGFSNPSIHIEKNPFLTM